LKKIVILVRRAGRGSEVMVGIEGVATFVAEKLDGDIYRDDEVWAVRTKFKPREVVEKLRGLKTPWGKLDPRIIGLGRGKGVMVCPVCGSTNIIEIGIGSWLAPPLYACEDCGYVGRIIVEVEEE